MKHKLTRKKRRTSRDTEGSVPCAGRSYYLFAQNLYLAGKVLTCVLLMLALAIFAACDTGKEEPEVADPPDIAQTDDVPPATDTPPAVFPPPPYDASIEYGDPDLITDNTGPLWAYIRFPAAGNETDEAIAEWASGVYQSALDEVAALREGDPDADGEINVQFDSYLVDGKYAGILENGIFMSSHLAHPVSIVRTFNIDVGSETFLANTDILDYSQLESVLSVMRARIAEEYPGAAGDIGEMDEQWLEHIAISHEGVIVVLERGVFLPAYLGALKVTLPYEQLGSAYKPGTAPEPSPTPQESPHVSPSESPSPIPQESPYVSPSASPSPTPQSPSPTPQESPADSPSPSPQSPSPTSQVSPPESPSPTPQESPPDSPSPTPQESPPESPSPTPQESPPESPSPTPQESPPESPSPSPQESPPESPPDPATPNAPPQRGDIDPSGLMVALTFDDGPSKYTAQILSILEKYNVRATFCVVGNLVNARKDTVKRASDLGCEIIGHSWDHRNLSKLSADEIRKEILDTNAVIESVTGVATRMFRPPYGAVSSTMKSVSAELGYAMINWSVDPLDWQTRNAEKVYNAIMADTGNRAIVLSHDLYGTTADAMERVIPELISRGYQLVTVSELMYYSNKTLEAGVIYHNGR